MHRPKIHHRTSLCKVKVPKMETIVTSQWTGIQDFFWSVALRKGTNSSSFDVKLIEMFHKNRLFLFFFNRIYDHQNGPHEWSDYMHQSKRSHIMMNTSAANGHLFTNYPSLFDYSTAPASHLEFANILDKVTSLISKSNHKWSCSFFVCSNFDSLTLCSFK